MAKSAAMPKLAGTGGYDVEVVGESHYQQNLVRIAGKQTRDGRRVECVATLFLETNNNYDPDAICVEIGGKPVGYIPRYVATDLRSSLKAIGVVGGMRVDVDALIVGGRTGENYGVWLDIDEDDEDDEDDDGEEAQEATVPVRPEPIMPDSGGGLPKSAVTVLLVLATVLAIGLMAAYLLR